MMKRYVLSLLSLLTLLPLTTYARLGDTERQCIERYGSAEPPPRFVTDVNTLLPGAHQSATYRYQGYRIEVAFLNGRVVRQRYHRTQAVNGSLNLSDAEIEAILKAESDGGTWKRVSPFKGQPGSQGITGALTQVVGSALFSNIIPTWERSTDKATARTGAGSSTLTLDTPEAVKAEADFRQARKAGTDRAIPKF